MHRIWNIPTRKSTLAKLNTKNLIYLSKETFLSDNLLKANTLGLANRYTWFVTDRYSSLIVTKTTLQEILMITR